MLKEDWYRALVEECDAALTESVFNSRWEIVRGYHFVGKRIMEDEDKDPKLVQRVAHSLNKSERTIFQAVQFYKKFPDLNSLPEGKNISWHKIANKLLPEPKEKAEPKEMCPTCGRAL